jgi:arylsulfatase A-like enzyme
MAKSDSPFCLSISFKAPHRPVQPDPEFDHVYAGKKFSKPANYGREHGKHFSKQSTMGRQHERFESWNYDKDYDGVMAKYHQQIYAIDVAVGMVRDALNKHGVADNTVIIYTSDNGFLCGSHGYGSKVLPYEEASRVPLLMFDPRHKNSGKRLRCASLTGNVDFAPTILELAGLSVPKNMDGKSLLKLYNDPKAQTHKALPLTNVWGPKAVHSFAVVTKDWKYIYWPYAEGELKATDELYHLAKDRLEMRNVIRDTDAKEALAGMRKSYDAAVAAWQKEAVPYHGYKIYGTIFDRKVKWSAKREAFLGGRK